MKYQRWWYKICVRGLCVNWLKLKINVRLSAEICLHQRLSVGEKHVLHFVQNLLIPKSVARHFNRYGICMTHQRQWYKICACWLCVKLLKLKINYPLYTALLSDWRVSDSSPLAYLRERTCELDIGAFLHCKDSKICFVCLAYVRGDEHAARKRISCGLRSIQARPAVLN